MVKTTLYELVKHCYIHDTGITEDYFNTHKNDIETSLKWALLQTYANEMHNYHEKWVKKREEFLNGKSNQCL